MKDAIDRFSPLGLKQQITALDISVNSQEKQKRMNLSGETDTLNLESEKRHFEQYEYDL